MPTIVREQANFTPTQAMPINSIRLIDRLTPILSLAVAVSSAAEAIGDRRMMNAITELGCRIEDDLTRLIDEIEETAQ